MGNTQGKVSQPSSRSHTRPSTANITTSPTRPVRPGASHERMGSGLYNLRSGGASRNDLFFSGARASHNAGRDAALEPRRETKAEREARKLEKERFLRAQERERSIRDESLDGGFLVTLGVYTGPEDFNKPIVRQLQIERRIAPFWKGLNDHEDTWTEHQLVAVVNGLPLPAPGETLPEDASQSSKHLNLNQASPGSEMNSNDHTSSIDARSMFAKLDRPENLLPLHSTLSPPSSISSVANNSSSSPFFRGRAKTLASLASGSRNASQTDMAPQEMHLPKDPCVNGKRIEAFLYQKASECPICFMFYPPYLNKTRCCDQPICSECFVQIKRPDPHLPEHHGDGEDSPPKPQEESQLVSEPAACPFCVQPEFGVTYEPPPFRRGLVYNGQSHNPLSSANSMMSSTSSLSLQNVVSPGRRRATSLAVNDKTVITTDVIRPDWAKKLADAKAHAMRRAAAATALHNAAYMIGNIQQHESRFTLGRRRRTIFGVETTISSGSGAPRREEEGTSDRAAEVSNDVFPGQMSSRHGNRLEDLEELMMMEAIRLSIAAEEERKKKEEKETAKEAKKEGKKKARETKKVAKAQRSVGSGFHPIDLEGLDDVDAGNSSLIGKGKAVDRSAGLLEFNNSAGPASVFHTSTSKDDSQKDMGDSAVQTEQEAFDPINLIQLNSHHDPSTHQSTLYPMSNASSSTSSIAESHRHSLHKEHSKNSNLLDEPSPNDSRQGVSEGPTPSGTPGAEPMFNFQSLTKAITSKAKVNNETQRCEIITEDIPNALKGTSTYSKELPEILIESVATVESTQRAQMLAATDDNATNSVSCHDSFDQKHLEDLRLVDSINQPRSTQ